MAAIEFVWNSKDLLTFRRDHAGKAVFQAVKRAGGDTIRSMRAQTKKLVRERSKIRAGYLADKALPLRFPQGRQTLDSLAWSMSVSGQVVPLGEFPRRQNRKGTAVEVLRGQRKMIQSAFIADRKGTARPSVFLRPTKERYPMGHMVGPSVANLFNGGKLADPVMESGQVTMSKRFEYWFSQAMNKR